MDASDFIELDESSSADRVYDALRQAAKKSWQYLFDADGYPDGLSVSAKTATGFDGGTSYEMRTTAAVYSITWTRYSWYRRATVTEGFAVIDRCCGVLSPDGSAWVDRWVVQLPQDDSEVDALLLLAMRGNLPGVSASVVF